MAPKNKALLILAIAGVLLYLFYLALYKADKIYDKWQQPWAYSTETPKRLVGEWTGGFTDPDGKKYNLQLEILLPETDDERWQKIARKHRRNRQISHKNNKAFDGIAYITNGQKNDTMLLNSGNLSKSEPPCDIKFNLSPIIDDNYPVGFQLAFVKGNWTGEKLDLKGEFVYHTPSGSGYSDSADPRFDYVASFVMERMK